MTPVQNILCETTVLDSMQRSAGELSHNLPTVPDRRRRPGQPLASPEPEPAHLWEETLAHLRRTAAFAYILKRMARQCSTINFAGVSVSPWHRGHRRPLRTDRTC